MIVSTSVLTALILSLTKRYLSYSTYFSKDLLFDCYQLLIN